MHACTCIHMHAHSWPKRRHRRPWQVHMHMCTAYACMHVHTYACTLMAEEAPPPPLAGAYAHVYGICMHARAYICMHTHGRRGATAAPGRCMCTCVRHMHACTCITWQRRARCALCTMHAYTCIHMHACASPGSGERGARSRRA